MASRWREVPIGELAEIFDGPHATPAKTDSGPVFLGISCLANGRVDLARTEHLSEEDYRRWTRRVEPMPADVVFSYETRLGEAALVPDGLRCCLGRRMGLLRARPGRIDNRFLLYAYLGPQFQETLRARTIHGSTVDRIPLIEMPDFPIVVPEDIDEQRAIAHILGTLDDKIELNRRMNETLEAMARALFKSWFVDFDPVRAKAEGRDTGLPPHIADLFPDSFEESELGEIPSGWEVARLRQVIEVNPPRALRKGDVAPYLDMANMPTRGHVPDQVADRAFGSGVRFTNGDTLVARITPCLENGKTALVSFLRNGEVGWGSTEFIVLRPRPPLPPEFGYCLARSEGFRESAIQSMTGTSGRQRVPAQALARFMLAMPSQECAEAFGGLVRPWFERAVSGESESRSLSATRDALLPDLIAGKIRVGAFGSSHRRSAA
ncbi:MAG: restriction endonuclease subunit S [Candidatus Bipolaricaulota bacterium]